MAQQEAEEVVEEEGKGEVVVEEGEEEEEEVVTTQDLVGDLVLSHIKAENRLGNCHQGMFTVLVQPGENVENAHKKVFFKGPENTLQWHYTA